MWQKLLIIAFLFYIFALLQNSFFGQFNLFGAVPNLVFALFFMLVFFENDRDVILRNYKVIFFAAVAGIFLDIFSYAYLGISIVLLIIIGFMLKKTQLLLKNKEDRYPFVYFLPLFLFFYLFYTLLYGICLSLLDAHRIAININSEIFFSLIYNLLFASVFFQIYKKFFMKDIKHG